MADSLVHFPWPQVQNILFLQRNLENKDKNSDHKKCLQESKIKILKIFQGNNLIN